MSRRSCSASRSSSRPASRRASSAGSGGRRSRRVSSGSWTTTTFRSAGRRCGPCSRTASSRGGPGGWARATTSPRSCHRVRSAGTRRWARTSRGGRPGCTGSRPPSASGGRRRGIWRAPRTTTAGWSSIASRPQPAVCGRRTCRSTSRPRPPWTSRPTRACTRPSPPLCRMS